MDPILADFLKFILVGLGGGILVALVFIFKPKKFKIGNIIDAEFADKEAGTVSINVDGTKRVYVPGEHVEIIITSVENALGDYIDEKGSYIKKAMQYTETRLKGFSGDITEALIKNFPKDLSEDDIEERIKLLGLIRKGVVRELAEFLKQSYYNNGFYEMRHQVDGRWFNNPEWDVFIKRQMDAIRREARHYLGEHIPYAWGMSGREALNMVWTKNGKLDEQSEDDYFYSLVEELYLSAWENQHIMKQKKLQYQKQRKSIVDLLKNGKLPE